MYTTYKNVMSCIMHYAMRLTRPSAAFLLNVILLHVMRYVMHHIILLHVMRHVMLLAHPSAAFLLNVSIM